MKEKFLIIPISGKAGAGKDTFGSILKTSLEKKYGFDVCMISFADYLKFGCKKYLGWSGDKTKDRTQLTETGQKMRGKNIYFWANVVCYWIEVLQDDYQIFIIPDWRFPNELQHLLTFPFTESCDVFSLRVDQKNFVSKLSEKDQNDISETALDDFGFFHWKALTEADNLGSVVSEVNALLRFLEGAYRLKDEK